MPDLKALRPLLGDPRQYASVRGITLDDGAERGQCALLFSTGGGLDFMVLTDRQMDIASLSLAGRQLGWQSPAGFVAPQLLSAEGDSAKGFDRGFSGFLVTCGLDHIGHPVPGHPHHGKLPYTPARLTAVGEDWAAGVLYAEGQSRQVRYGAEMLALTRRIEAAIGGTSLTIRDRIENLGPTAQPVELMYHFNLGHPAITTGCEITLDGAPTTGPLTLPMPTGPGAATFHPVGHTGTAQCMITGQGVTTHLTFNGGELPCLQLWHDLRAGIAVQSIEPRNFLPDATPPTLAPGEAVTITQTLNFSAGPTMADTQR